MDYRVGDITDWLSYPHCGAIYDFRTFFGSSFPFTPFRSYGPIEAQCRGLGQWILPSLSIKVPQQVFFQLLICIPDGARPYGEHVPTLTNALVFPLPKCQWAKPHCPTLPRICRSDSAIILANRSLFVRTAITVQGDHSG